MTETIAVTVTDEQQEWLNAAFDESYGEADFPNEPIRELLRSVWGALPAEVQS